jgi:hypothetical protein
MKNQTEIFKPIPGTNGMYEVSNYGRVKSLNPDSRSIFGKVLSPIVCQRYNYLLVSLQRNYKGTRFVHRLVAMCFLPNPNKYRCVNHKDFNRQNNRVENLEWCSHKQNYEHSNAAGRYSPNRLLRAKLTKAQAEEIRRRYIPRKVSLARLAKEFGVSSSTIKSTVEFEQEYLR